MKNCVFVCVAKKFSSAAPCNELTFAFTQYYKKESAIFFLDNSCERKENSDEDFNFDFVPVIAEFEKSATVSLLLFSDGVSIKKSTAKKELWHDWI